MRNRGNRMKWTAKRIKELRKSLGETQEQFKDHFRVVVGTVRSWEQGWGNPVGPAEVILDQLEQRAGESPCEKPSPSAVA